MKRLYKRNDANIGVQGLSFRGRSGVRVGFDLATANDESEEEALLEEGYVINLHELDSGDSEEEKPKPKPKAKPKAKPKKKAAPKAKEEGSEEDSEDGEEGSESGEGEE